MTTTPLRLARLAAGLRQADLAAVIDRSQMFVHRLEVGGPARLTPEIADKLAAAVNVPAALLFSRRNPREKFMPNFLESLLSRAERRALARRLGIAQWEVSAILRGGRHIADARIVAEVARAAGVPVEQLGGRGAA